MLGISQIEVYLFIMLPFLASFVLAIFLLFSWRGFVALLAALAAFVVYVVIGLFMIRHYVVVSLFMLLFSGWAVVTFLAIALYVSIRGRAQ